MKRTTIKLPDDLDAKLRFEARRRGMTISELSREAIATYLAADGPRRLRGAGAGDSGLADLAARLDDYLASDGFGEDAWS